MQCRSLWPTSRYPVTNAAQFFQGDTATGVFGLNDNALTDDVICVGRKTPLFSRQFAQTETGRLCTFGLQFSAQLAMSVANLFNRLPLVYLPVAVNGDIGYTEVNAQEVLKNLCRRFVYIAALKKVKFAFSIGKIALATQANKQLGGVLTDDKGHFLATVQNGNRNDALIQLVGDKSIIERKSAKWFESALGVLIALVGICDFSKHPDGNVGGNAKRTQVGVTEFVERKLTKGLCLPSCITDDIARSVGGLKRLLEHSVLLFGRLQLDSGD